MKGAWALAAIVAIVALSGCNAVDSNVSQADVEKNRKDFSQESYEDAMRKAGRGDELEAEKKRNEDYMKSQGGQ